MSSEDENYVTVTVEARGHECSILCARQWWQRWGRTASPAHRFTSAPSTRSRLGFSRKQPSRSCSLPESAPASPWTPCASSSSTPRCTAGSRRRKSGARSTTTSTPTGACADTLYEAFRQAGAPDGLARKLMLIAVLGADPRGHADSVQTLDLDARREIRDMAAKLGVDADF